MRSKWASGGDGRGVGSWELGMGTIPMISRPIPRYLVQTLAFETRVALLYTSFAITIAIDRLYACNRCMYPQEL